MQVRCESSGKAYYVSLPSRFGKSLIRAKADEMRFEGANHFGFESEGRVFGPCVDVRDDSKSLSLQLLRERQVSFERAVLVRAVLQGGPLPDLQWVPVGHPPGLPRHHQHQRTRPLVTN